MNCDNCLHDKSLHLEIGCIHEDEEGVCICDEFEEESHI